MFRHRHGHPHHGHRRGPPPWAPQWLLAKGIHRNIAQFGIWMVALGAVVGAVGRSCFGGLTPGAVFAAFAVIGLVAWPISWMVTWRIVRPLRELAAVAGDLKSGSLGARSELPSASGEVGEVADALRGMGDRLARQLADQRALMAAVSHELRSPLGRARVLVEMGREGSAPPDLFGELEAEIVAMDDLVADLLAAARIDFEAVTPREMRARDAALRAVEIARLAAEVLAAGPDPLVRADPTLLARALAGLLENARRYGGPAVTLTIAEEGGRVTFTVDDDGPGFSDGDEERVFAPFWRAPGRVDQRGVGLGLALVRQIAEAHGGRAGAANRAGGGARVWLTLPAGHLSGS